MIHTEVAAAKAAGSARISPQRDSVWREYARDPALRDRANVKELE